MKKITIATMLLVMMQTLLFGSNFYVSPNGNDNYIGSLEYPWKTLEHSFETVQAGDTLYIRGGTYIPTTTNSLKFGFRPTNSGTVDAPITITNYQNEVVWIDGKDIVFAAYWYGVINLDYRSHIIIDGLKIKNSPLFSLFTSNSIGVIFRNNYITESAGSGIYAGGKANNLIIENNELDKCVIKGQNEAISLVGVYNVTVRNNHIHHDRHEDVPSPHGNGIGIDVKNSSHHIDIYNNEINNMLTAGIYIDARGAVTDINIYNNFIHDNESRGIVMSTETASDPDTICKDVHIYNNILTRNNDGITLGWSSTPPNPLQNIYVYNNTIYKNRKAGISLATTTGSDMIGSLIYVASKQVPITQEMFNSWTNFAKNINITNNIIALNGQGDPYYGFTQIMEWPKEIKINEYTIENNLFQLRTDLAQLGYASNNYNGNNPKFGDPLFVDPINDNLHIQKESPAINSAQGLMSEKDYAGIVRASTGGADMGAFEFISGTDGSTSQYFIISKDNLLLVEDQ